MDWEAELRERLSEKKNLTPYRLAVAIEGHPLPWGRRVYALSDVLAVDPGDFMVDLRVRFNDDNEQVERFIDSMASIADEACGFVVPQPDDVQASDTYAAAAQELGRNRVLAWRSLLRQRPGHRE